MKELRRHIESYAPCDAREAQDKAGLIYALEHLETPFSRENPIAHFTASAWIVNPARNRVLMVWHNIYRTWSWTGGHADGEADLLAVALREAREETGLQPRQAGKVRLLPPSSERHLSPGGRRRPAHPAQARREQRRSVDAPGRGSRE